MSIRLPLSTLLDVNNSTINSTGPASVNGGVAHPFLIPQDTDNIIVKFTASVMAGGASAVLQTSDDGGTNWYDVARTSIVSNAIGQNAQWLSTPVIGIGVRTTLMNNSVAGGQAVASIYQATGQATSLAQLSVSGLPILGRNARVFLLYTAAVTSIISERVTVSANSQSAGT